MRKKVRYNFNTSCLIINCFKVKILFPEPIWVWSSIISRLAWVWHLLFTFLFRFCNDFRVTRRERTHAVQQLKSNLFGKRQWYSFSSYLQSNLIFFFLNQDSARHRLHTYQNVWVPHIRIVICVTKNHFYGKIIKNYFFKIEMWRDTAWKSVSGPVLK